MTPTEIELRATLQRLADYARTEPPAAHLGPTIGEERRRPRQVWTAGVAAAALVVAAVTGVALSRRSGSSAIEGGLAAERLAGAGLAGRWGPSSVWTGRELLVWGGLTSENRSLADGAALDPVANRWRPLPPAPIGARSGAPAVWTGSEMLVWGGLGEGGKVLLDGAAFDPGTNRWRTIASQPFQGSSRSAAVWTGSEMVVVSALNGLNATAYDPATDRWRRLADPPGAPLMPYQEAVWTGSQVVLILWPSGPRGFTFGSSEPSSPPSTVAGRPADTSPGDLSPPPLPPVTTPAPMGGGPNSGMFVAAYTPATDQWSRLPAVNLKDGGVPRMVWTGSEVLVLQRSFPGAAYDPGRRAWRPLAPLPGESLPDTPAVWTGRQALLWSGGDEGLAYDLQTDSWSTFDAGGLRKRSDPVVVWAGDALVGWGGYYDTGRAEGRHATDGVRYRPPS